MKYTVNMAVDGRIDIEVEADTPEEAFEKAEVAFGTADLTNMVIVGRNPVNCSDEYGDIVKDYE